jgi:hypothetical protein
MLWHAVLGVLLIASTASANELQAPPGWRFPTDADYKGKWIEYRDHFPVPYRVVADFDGNGQQDEAWILIRDKGEGYALYVFMRNKKGKARTVKIYSSDECCAQDHAVSLVNPGKILTVCGQMPDECPPSEPKSITLRHPGFDSISLGTASALYYWDSKLRGFKGVSDAD